MFRDGQYVPLRSIGEYAKHVVAFARTHKSEKIIVAVPRLCARLLKGEARLPSGADLWKDTKIHLSDGMGKVFCNCFTGTVLEAEAQQSGSVLTAAELFDQCPVALLTPA